MYSTLMSNVHSDICSLEISLQYGESFLSILHLAYHTYVFQLTKQPPWPSFIRLFWIFFSTKHLPLDFFDLPWIAQLQPESRWVSWTWICVFDNWSPINTWSNPILYFSMVEVAVADHLVADQCGSW